MEPPKRPAKPSWIRRGAIAATAAGAIALSAVGLHTRAVRQNPHNWETPEMVAAARAGDFAKYDRGAFERHPYLRGSSPIVLRHWDRLTRIAGKDFNVFTVADTLSRAPRSITDLNVEITEQNNAMRNSRDPEERARAKRKVMIFESVRELAKKDPGVEQMLQEMYGLPSRPIAEGREVFYGGSWERGRLRSGAHLSPTPTPRR